MIRNMKRILMTLTFFLFLLISNSCEQAGEDSDITATTIPEITVGMLQHNVYFYLNDDVTEDERAQFEDGLHELLSIDEIFKSHIGTPGSTPERDVTDHSFGYSIFTWFESSDDYDVYAEHPIHLDFIDKYSHLWADVKVYDSEIIRTID